MSTRLLLLAAALLLSLPLLGYYWPHPDAAAPNATDDRWAWPETPAPAQPAKAPQRLATFWPGQMPTAGTDGSATPDKPAANRRDWALIGVIRQGKSLSALVQDPQQNIVTLKPGDRLDEARSVSELEPTRLHWQDNDGRTGELLLYPTPTPE